MDNPPIKNRDYPPIKNADLCIEVLSEQLLK